MRISTTVGDRQGYASGAINFDDNLATNCGYGALISGGLLSCAIGTAVAPLPTLGLMTVGAGTVCAANYKQIRNHFRNDGDLVIRPTETEEAPTVA